MTPKFDCVVAGSCVVDLLCHPVPLDRPIGVDALLPTAPTVLLGGGITSNAGIPLARLGMQVGVLSYVGDDAWGPVVRGMYDDAGVDTSMLLTHVEAPTSTTVAVIDASGERSFLHCAGAPRALDARAFLERLDVFAQTRMLLLGYYGLTPRLEPDLAEVFARVREVGCKTALDSSGDGGTMDPLERILPQVDVYFPSLKEAAHQTGLREPERMLERFREAGAPGVVGVKLGAQGVVVSERSGEVVEVPAVAPPGAVVDTTGAGDSFFAARLGAAAGADCVAAVGGNAGARDFAATAALAGLDS